ncbi:host cell division inhibitor Icd-like protein [Salmonella enterica]|nr:host cell division inhibitor Icd-like protein [Salmonella enterica]
MATVSGSFERNFTWLFLAVSRSNPEDKPRRVSVTAPDEQSARKLLAGDYTLTFAGRIPAHSEPAIVAIPHVRRLSEEVLSYLDPDLLSVYRERRELLARFKAALNAAGVAFVEGADHE